MRLLTQIATVSILLLSTLSLCSQAATGTKRLILKNGEYQTATQWEVRGDRVRYYSAERYDWEELPVSLVDWPATQAYEESVKSGNATARKAAAAEDAADQAEIDARTPQVAPGLRLPDGGGVFLLDEYQKIPQLAELVQSGSEINKQTGKNILRAAINPLATAKQSIELHGQRARIQAHTTPSVFVNVDLGDESDSDSNTTPAAAAKHDTDQSPNRFKLVRAKVNPKRGTRVVGNLKILVIGKVKQEADEIPVVAQVMPGGWTRITPSQPLAPGEYALVEMLNQKEMNLYVWDFGVDPNAPPNPGSWKPAPQVPLPSGTNESPYLNSRPPAK